jgi:hypothetical protein
VILNNIISHTLISFMQLQYCTPVSSAFFAFHFGQMLMGLTCSPLQRSCVGPSQLSPLNTTNSYARNPWAKSAQQIPKVRSISHPLGSNSGTAAPPLRWSPPPCRLVRHTGHPWPAAAAVGIPDKHGRRRFLPQESPRRWNPTLSGPPAFLTLTLATLWFKFRWVDVETD